MANKKPATKTGWHVTWGLTMPECRALAGVIRRLREQRGWSLSMLSKASGVSRQMLGGVEDDQKNPSLDTTSRIAAAFGMPLYQLHLLAFRWLQRQPASCRKCHYSCVHRGRAMWLNVSRQCIRPLKTLLVPPAILPV